MERGAGSTTPGTGGSGLESALLDVRLFPWRPRARVMEPDRLRDLVDIDLLSGDDLTGLVIGLGLWLAIIVAAPVLVLVLAAGLFSVELPVVIVVASAVVLLRFAGVVPWTVVTVDRVTLVERREQHRNLLRALRTIRAVNGDRRVLVRWAWA